MEILIENMWGIWLLAAIFFLLIEAVTTALVSIWFVPAAVITCILSIFIKSIWLQISIFIILSIVFMCVFRRLYKTKIKKKNDELELKQRLLNKRAIATELIDGYSGKVLIGDIYWKAKTIDNSVIKPDTSVIIKEINGTTVLVKKG